MAILRDYKAKRRFTGTPEPKGVIARSKGPLRFVVQRHQASRLHYDFRLQLQGVLKSWAVPKGPSMNPADKRLAVHVEDHPLDYADFKGEIPKGNYGAGIVEIWDNGTFTPVDGKGKKISEARAVANLENGELKVQLDGNYLKGGFVLVKLGDEKNWLLIKHRDEHAVDEPYDAETLKPVSHRSKRRTKQPVDKPVNTVRMPFTGKEKKLARFVKPMLATLHGEPFDNDEWYFEIKWDGYRAIAERKGKEVKLYSRNGLSFMETFPPVAAALKKIGHDAILDGEIVVLDDQGKPSFQLLQQFGEDPEHPIVFYVFDLLMLNGKDLTGLSLAQRKELLKHLFETVDDPVIRYCDHIEGSGKAFFKQVSKMGLEGVIAKRAGSAYSPGVRSKQWLKIKNNNSTEAVIIGFTQPKGSRKHFGALLLAQFQDDKLRYIGHAGTGFDDKTLEDLMLRMKRLVTRRPPVDEKIKLNGAVTWLKPVLVCHVKFTEQTRDGMLRHPVYQGLRVDKEPREVTVANDLMPDDGSQQSEAPKNEHERIIRIGKNEVKLTNIDKIYWPEDKITKGQMLDYYERMAKWILPYLKDRPLSLKRNVNGIRGKAFYHKDAGENAPPYVETEQVASGSSDKVIDYIVCNNKETLMYVANLGSIEMNPWNSTRRRPDHPTYIVIDIDPSEGNSFSQVIEAAMATREVLEKAGATYYVKTSGATGLHVYVPLAGKYAYEPAKEFAHIVAMLTQELVPDFTTLERLVNKRGQRIYIDYLQNRKGQTLASAYSVRPVPGAQVSAPLLAKELKPGLEPSRFNIFNMQKRVEQLGDVFYPVLGKGNDIRNCLRNLGR